MDAYLSLMSTGVAGQAYNVCSGVGTSVRDLAALVLARMGKQADIRRTSTLSRPVDVPTLVGSNAKLHRATGWTPRLTRDDIIDDLIHAATH